MTPGAQAAATPGDPIAAVVDGTLHPASLDDAGLEAAINRLHRMNPPRTRITDACVTEYHKRKNPPPNDH